MLKYMYTGTGMHNYISLQTSNTYSLFQQVNLIFTLSHAMKRITRRFVLSLFNISSVTAYIAHIYPSLITAII